MVLKGKKGVFFTLSVILILSLFLASFSLYGETKDRKEIQKRVDTLNNFISSVEKDLERKVYITGYRTIFLAEREIVRTNNKINDIDKFFNEAFINGTVNGIADDVLTGYNISAMLSRAGQNAEKIGSNIYIENGSLIATQTDPWNVKFILTIDLRLEDKSGLAKWDRKGHQIIAYVPITNFEDPTYYLKTSGKVSNKIIKSNLTFNTDPSQRQNLSLHVNNSYYINNSKAPSFLDRLEGNLTGNNPNGIESFVNLQNLKNQGLNVKIDESLIDYEYFDSNDDLGDYYSGLPSWFRIDEDHKAFYGIPASETGSRPA